MFMESCIRITNQLTAEKHRQSHDSSSRRRMTHFAIARYSDFCRIGFSGVRPGISKRFLHRIPGPSPDKPVAEIDQLKQN